MPDKEERIEISTYDLNNKEWNGDIPIDIHKVYTRQEAIEVMANAICWEREHYPFKELPQYAIDYYIKQAEAALNALLEGFKK